MSTPESNTAGAKRAGERDRQKRVRAGPFAERVRRRLDATIFALLLFVTALSVVPYGSVDPWWDGAAEASVFALGALWAVEGALGGSWLVPAHRLLVPVVALIAYAVAQTLLPAGHENIAGVEVRFAVSADPFETLRFALKLSALALATALWLRYASNVRRLRAAVFLVVGVCVASALFGFARQAVSAGEMAALSPRLASNLDGYAQFINRNHFALLMEMGFGLALGLAVAESARPHKSLLYLAAAALPMWTALVMSRSRGGILGMVGGLLFFALVALSSLRAPDARGARTGVLTRWAARADESLAVRAALVACLLVSVLAGVVWVGGERLASRLDEMSGALSAEATAVRWGDSRVEIWGATLRLIREHPLCGVGFGAYRAGVTPYHDASGEMSLEQAHNDYLELLACGGLIGAALVAWLVAAFIIHVRGRLRAAGYWRRAVCVGALAGMFAAMVHGLFDFGLHVTANAFVFTALASVSAIED